MIDLTPFAEIAPLENKLIVSLFFSMQLIESLVTSGANIRILKISVTSLLIDL
jgi:hypothetical protein